MKHIVIALLALAGSAFSQEAYSSPVIDPLPPAVSVGQQVTVGIPGGSGPKHIRWLLFTFATGRHTLAPGSTLDSPSYTVPTLPPGTKLVVIVWNKDTQAAANPSGFGHDYFRDVYGFRWDDTTGALVYEHYLSHAASTATVQ